MQSQAGKQDFQFSHMHLMCPEYSSNLGGLFIPIRQDILRRHLGRRKLANTVIQGAQQSLPVRQMIQILPILRSRVFLKGGFPPQRNQKQVPERMHSICGRPSRKDGGTKGVLPAGDNRRPGRWAWHCGSGSRFQCKDEPRRCGSPCPQESAYSSQYGVQ